MKEEHGTNGNTGTNGIFPEAFPFVPVFPFVPCSLHSLCIPLNTFTKGGPDMKRLFSIVSVIPFALILFVSVAAQAPSIAGEWEGEYNTPGPTRKFRVVFKVDGEKITGELKREMDQNPTPIQGTITGKDLKFTWTMKYQDRDLQIIMTGPVEGDTVKGRIDFNGEMLDKWSAKRVSSSGAASSAATTGDKLDITGSWDFEIKSEAGTGNPTFTFKQENEKLTGKYKGRFGEADLTGAVKGNQIEFSFKITNPVEGVMTYTGAIDGNTMKGKVSVSGMGEATFTGKKK